MDDLGYMRIAIEEAATGLAEGGVPVGAALVADDRLLGSGHNRRVQQGSAIRHGETDCLENIGRLHASVYRRATMYTTLSPCDMCTGAILLYGIPRVVIGENETFLGGEDLPALTRRRGRQPRPGRVQGAHGRVHRSPSRDLERGHRRDLTATRPRSPASGLAVEGGLDLGLGLRVERGLVDLALEGLQRADDGRRVAAADDEERRGVRREVGGHVLDELLVHVLVKRAPDEPAEGGPDGEPGQREEDESRAAARGPRPRWRRPR